MNIIIAGNGKVGSTLTRLLSTEGHDVTLIDKNTGRLFIYRQARLFSRASIFLMGSQMEETLISWLMAATK